jgi:broad specificity phosphatase PhoE
MSYPTTNIYILRHAQTESNVKNIFGGDPLLTELGKKQAKSVVDNLPLEKISAIYSSQLQRAIDTANIIKAETPHIIEIVTRENLRERHFGNLEDKEILQDHKDIHNKVLVKSSEMMWDVHLTDDDETFRESHSRFVRELERIAANHPGETILIVSHGSVMRGLLVSLQYADFGQLRSGTIKNTGIIRLDYCNGELSLKEVVGVKLRG